MKLNATEVITGTKVKLKCFQKTSQKAYEPKNGKHNASDGILIVQLSTVCKVHMLRYTSISTTTQAKTIKDNGAHIYSGCKFSSNVGTADTNIHFLHCMSQYTLISKIMKNVCVLIL